MNKCCEGRKTKFCPTCGTQLRTDKPIEQLLPYIAEKLKQNPDKPVILRTDPSASDGNMIAVFDELRQAEDKVGFKIETISIPTQREIENIWTLLGIG